jgi:predicted metalloprotease with PDZ domain
MAFPSLPDDQHWMEEGLATYIEPIARVQTGELRAERIWADMMDGMPKGEPAADDRGLDKTHTWGSTYWGGALFCLVADVTIRQQTKNQKGLQDALRAIVEAGGTIDHDWPLPRTLQVGDKATGTTVLTDMYKKWGDSPVVVNLPQLWAQLGVRDTASGIVFDSKAPLAPIREAITAPHKGPFPTMP